MQFHSVKMKPKTVNFPIKPHISNIYITEVLQIL